MSRRKVDGKVRGWIWFPLWILLACIVIWFPDPGGDDPQIRQLILQNRLWTALALSGTGGALALSGMLLQQIFANPLMSPFTLGVAGGAALGTSLALILEFPLVPGAFAGALGILGALGIFVGLVGRQIPVSAILVCGIILGTGSWALAHFFLFSWQEVLDITKILKFWQFLLGKLDGFRENDVLLMGMILLPICIIAWWMGPSLDVLAAGEDFARSLGYPVRKIFFSALLMATVLAAVSVSVAGVIGFVGLVVPNVVRAGAGSTVRNQVIPVVWAGACFLLLVRVANLLLPSHFIIPPGIATAWIGTIYFVGMLIRILRDPQGRG